MKETVNQIVFEVTHSEFTTTKIKHNPVTGGNSEISVIMCKFVGKVNGKVNHTSTVEMYKLDEIEAKKKDVLDRLKLSEGLKESASLAANMVKELQKLKDDNENKTEYKFNQKYKSI